MMSDAVVYASLNASPASIFSVWILSMLRLQLDWTMNTLLHL